MQTCEMITSEPIDGEGSPREAFYREVVELIAGEERVICESAGPDGHFFTLMSRDLGVPDVDVSQKLDTYEHFKPTLTLSTPLEAPVITLKNPLGYNDTPPDDVVLGLFNTALSQVAFLSRDVVLKIQPGTLNQAQIDLIAELGFKQIKCGNFIYQPAETESEIPAKQLILNRGLEDEILSRLYGEVLLKTTYEQQLHSARMSLQLAIIKQGLEGIDAAYDLLETARLKFHYAFGFIVDTPEDPAKKRDMVEPDFSSLIEYAGVLARLAGCSNLQPYDSNPVTRHPDSAARDKHEDYFQHALNVYAQAKELLGENSSDRDRFLISSGIAEARMLRVEYLRHHKSARHSFGITINVAKARGGRKIRAAMDREQKQATDELESVKGDIHTEAIMAQVDQQIAELLTHEFSLSGGTSEDGVMPTADQALFELADI